MPRVAPSGDPWRRVQLGGVLLLAVLVVGTVGYLLLGLTLLCSMLASGAWPTSLATASG